MVQTISNREENKIKLRAIERTDAEFLRSLNNDLEIAKHVVGSPRIVSLQEQIEWMEVAINDDNAKRFIVEYNDSPVGTVIISNINWNNLTANISIKLKRDARGKGIGKTSIILGLRQCFETMGVLCVTAHVLPFNQASLALFESCGFEKEGVLRSRVIKENNRYDLVSFSILRDEFDEN